MTDINTKPLFSIVIPTLNEEKYLPLLLRDLARQSFKDFEVIIADGKSEDFTRREAYKFINDFKKFTFLETERRNVSVQRNLGAKNAEADWIIFLDADNRLPYYFLQGIKFQSEYKQADIFSTRFETDSGDNKGKAMATLSNIYFDLSKNSPKPFLLEAMICMKKTTFLKLKGFNEKLTIGEGSDLLARARKKKLKYEFLKEPKYTYSLRRLRRVGTLRTLKNNAEIELSRLLSQKISDEKASSLYPMEGGLYFEINENERNRIETFFVKLLEHSQAQISVSKTGGYLKHLFEKYFYEKK